MTRFICLLLFFSTTMVVAQDETTTTPQIVIKVSLGETVNMGDIILEFVEVLEDSRCPKDVDCVWAGQARVKVVVSGDGIIKEQLDLVIGKKNEYVIGSVNGFAIKAVGLIPYPSTKNTGKRLYSLLVLKEKI